MDRGLGEFESPPKQGVTIGLRARIGSQKGVIATYTAAQKGGLRISMYFSGATRTGEIFP
jgi:hypothetical protein